MELEHEGVGAGLAQRRHDRMAKDAVGFARHAGEVELGDLAAREWADDLDRDFRIGLAGETRDGLAIEPRPGLRHVEAAVAGEARERHIDKAERRGFAAGRDVAH